MPIFGSRFHYINTPAGRVKVLRPGAINYPLRRGMVLHHGTDPSNVFRQLLPAAFVGRWRETAEQYATDSARWRKPGDTRPGKVLEYELVDLPTVIDFRIAGWERALSFKGKERSRSYLTSQKYRNRIQAVTKSKIPEGLPYNPIVSPRLCRSNLPVDGWIASQPAELMLCEPNRFLRYRGSRRLRQKPQVFEGIFK